MTYNNEHALITPLRQKEPKAFTVLFEQFSDKIFRLAAGLLKDEDEAEGIVQETFLRLFQKLDQFKERSKLGTWLYRVAYNASIGQLRDRARTQPLVAEDSPDETAVVMPAILTDWSNAPEAVLY